MIRDDQGALPTFVIIGAMTCGTTSLHRYLDLHPQISMSGLKETNFFEERWGRGIGWYRSLFDPEAPVRGESSTVYTKYPSAEGIPERMHRVIPDARLVYLVRDPIERIVSHYVHNLDRGRISTPIERVLADPRDNHYVHCSRYFFQIERFLEHWDPARILVLSLEELSSDPAPALRRVLRHVGADETFEWGRSAFERHGTSGRKLSPNAVGRVIARGAHPIYRALRDALPPLVGSPLGRVALPDGLRDEIAGILAEDVRRLRAFSGESLAGWLPGWS